MTQRRFERRSFLRSMAGGAVAAAASSGLSRAALAQAVTDPEALEGSPRWPDEGLRPRDFYNRYRVLGEWMAIRKVPGDVDAYLATWRAPRERATRRAEAFEKEGRRVSAADAYLQASAFGQREYVLHLRLGDREQAGRSYREVRALFDKGAALAGPQLPYERVSIPYEGSALSGILILPPGPRERRWPVIYRTGGTDSTKEASFLGMLWAPFTDRGVGCFFMDGPGQGQALNEQGKLLVPDYERPVKAAFDYLGSRKDVDAKRLGLWGQSTGGYFGARGALPGTGAAAVVLQGAVYDLLADCYEFCPSFRRHLRFMLGAADDAKGRELLKDYTLRGRAERITVPISIVHGTQDDGVRFEGAQRLAAEIASKEKSFKPQDAARTLGDSAPDAVTDLVDWICGRLTA